MKALSSLLCGGLLSVLSWNCAWAETITVSFTARVVSLFDSADALDGELALDQIVTGEYFYDSSVPNSQPSSPNFGEYDLGAERTNVRIPVGSLTFEGNAPVENMVRIGVLQSVYPGMGGQFSMLFSGNRDLANGAIVNSIEFVFRDSQGQLPSSTALPATAPDVQIYEERSIVVSGAWNGNWYQVTFEIESAELVEPPHIEISPASSSFHPQQRFDAILWLPAGAVVSTLEARAGGAALPLRFPWECQDALPDSEGRMAIVCPDAHLALTAMPPGVTEIEWRAELLDGTVLTDTVAWKVIQ